MKKVLWLVEHVKIWFLKFYAGDFLLDNALQSGRLVEIDNN